MEKKSLLKRVIDGFKHVISVFKSDEATIDTSAEMSADDRITALSNATGSSENEIAGYEAAFNEAEANLQRRLSGGNKGLNDYVISDFNDAQIAKDFKNNSSGRETGRTNERTL